MPTLTPVDNAELAAHSAQADRLTLVAFARRPGVARYWITLEYDHFPPGTPKNAAFDLYHVAWPEPTMRWTVAILPLLNLTEARAAATASGMRLANGVPQAFGVEGRVMGIGVHREPLTPDARFFPIAHARVFTIENDKTSPIYLPGGPSFIVEEERRWIAAFRATHGLP